MPDTLYLDPKTWDFALDSRGNIAVASEPYSLAQDAASAIRVWLGEVYYDTTQGLPYKNQILGQRPPIELVRSKMVAAALTVPNVASATIYFNKIGSDRTLSGQVQITSTTGQSTTATF